MSFGDHMGEFLLELNQNWIRFRLVPEPNSQNTLTCIFKLPHHLPTLSHGTRSLMRVPTLMPNTVTEFNYVNLTMLLELTGDTSPSCVETDINHDFFAGLWVRAAVVESLTLTLGSTSHTFSGGPTPLSFTNHRHPPTIYPSVCRSVFSLSLF